MPEEDLPLKSATLCDQRRDSVNGEGHSEKGDFRVMYSANFMVPEAARYRDRKNITFSFYCFPVPKAKRNTTSGNDSHSYRTSRYNIHLLIVYSMGNETPDKRAHSARYLSCVTASAAAG